MNYQLRDFPLIINVSDAYFASLACISEADLEIQVEAFRETHNLTPPKSPRKCRLFTRIGNGRITRVAEDPAGKTHSVRVGLSPCKHAQRLEFNRVFPERVVKNPLKLFAEDIGMDELTKEMAAGGRPTMLEMAEPRGQKRNYFDALGYDFSDTGGPNSEEPPMCTYMGAPLVQTPRIEEALYDAGLSAGLTDFEFWYVF